MLERNRFRTASGCPDPGPAIGGRSKRPVAAVVAGNREKSYEESVPAEKKAGVFFLRPL